MSATSPVLVFRPGHTPEPADVRRADFSDPESQRVLSDAARALAEELGRQAAREWFAQMTREVRR